MRLLLCSPVPFTPQLGAGKVRLELAEALTARGWHCDLRGPDAGAGDPAGLFDLLRKRAWDYDVVDYDHECLPFPRDEFAPRPLLVARVPLLVQHLESLTIPEAQGFRANIGRWVNGGSRRRALAARIERADRTVAAADLVNVHNHRDRAELVRRGIPARKIVVLPCGITEQRRAQFDAVSLAPPALPVVAFVGTFDYRKGASDFPAICWRILEAVPDVTFRLLGTRGLFRTAQQVLEHFPVAMRERIVVHPTFEPGDLPRLLETASVGIFPSYYEGFGYGMLEMLAAAVPVVAYDAPGPPEMVPPEYLVSPGDVAGMADRVIALLQDRAALRRAREEARSISRRFGWGDVARATAEACQAAIEARAAWGARTG